MFDYLQQFNNLAKDLRDRVSSPSVMAIIADLESKYRVDLAMTVMKVMIKSLSAKNLPAYFISELGLPLDSAEALAQEMKEKIFVSVADYLGLSSEMRALDLDKDINILIKESGLVLPSAVLIGRFKNIVSTYLRGVRNKIDTKNSLSKDVKIGGLSLSSAEVDRVLKVCDTQKFASLKISPDAAPQPTVAPGSRLDKIIASSDNIIVNKDGKAEEYSLKNALATGQIKIPASISTSTPTLAPTPTPTSTPTSAPASISPRIPVSAPIRPKTILDTKHEISAPRPQLDLPVGHMPVPTPPTPPAAPISKPAPVNQVSQVNQVNKSVVSPSPAVNKIAPASQSISKPSSLFSRFTSKLSPLRGAASQPIVKNKVPNISQPISNSSLSIKPAMAQSAANANLLANSGLAKSANSSILSPASPAPAASASVQAPKAAAPSLTNRPAPASPARPQMHDIKPVPKVMGPIEELQFLDVVNFRRLGKTPGESITKVFMKIKLLEKDGYDKMIAGIQAWRQSPVNRLYLRLGQEAVARGVPFKESVALRQKNNQEYLSMEEIEAIVSLNSRLVF